MKMKIKTSVSINSKTLKVVKKIAAEQERSVSYVLEKFIEAKVNETPQADPAPKVASTRRVNYDGKKK